MCFKYHAIQSRRTQHSGIAYCDINSVFGISHAVGKFFPSGNNSY